MSGWPKSKDKTSVKRNRFERKIVFQQLFFRGNVGFRGCMFRVKTILPLTNVQLCSSISSGLGIFQRYVSSIDTYTVHFSSCHDLGRTIVFNILHYIKTIKSTHKTSLFFWVFTEKPCDFLVKPTIFATHHPPDPKKKHHKKKKQRKIHFSIRIGNVTSLGLDRSMVDTSRSETRRMAGFLLR